MKKLVCLSIGMLAFALQPFANAQSLPAPTTLFTTYDDFSTFSAGWGAAPTAVNTFSTDASTVNGIANPTAPGGAGTSGALLINAGVGATGGLWTDAATAPSPSGFAAVNAFDPGYDSVNGLTSAAHGEFYIDYSLPDNEGGTYFGVGVLVQYAGNGYFGTWFQNSAVDLGYTEPTYGEEVYRATIPYTVTAGGGIGGYGFGVMLSTDYQSALPFYVDNISVAAVQDTPEPGTIALISLGLAGLTIIRRRQS